MKRNSITTVKIQETLENQIKMRQQATMKELQKRTIVYIDVGKMEENEANLLLQKMLDKFLYKIFCDNKLKGSLSPKGIFNRK